MAALDRRPAFVGRVAMGIAFLLLPFLLGCTLQQYPQSTLSPRADYAWDIQHLLNDLMFWVVLIFVLVEGALIVAVIRFRDRPGMPEPKPVHGHTGLEIGWTIAPAVILAFIAVPTVATIFKTQGQAPAGALQVRVIGHQWWWEFQYPEYGITTGSELHVPIGRPVSLSLETADVIHSFWFPAMGGKRDVTPTHVNHIWFTANTVGTYPGQCAELCGISHANMRMRLFVQTPEEFQTWVAGQKRPPIEPDTTSLAGMGKQVFLTTGCVACHTIEGISPGTIGPNLTHVGSRTSLAGAILPNDPDHMGRWISDPPAHKPGAIMPKLGLKPDQVTAVVAYLQSLK